MGVITYLFHRSQGLTPQRYNMFFLDVGENIHFHYRDLRIELSTGEFEELAAGFAKYAPSVLEMIRKEGYRDGVLPNTNAHDTIRTFWDKGRLANPVKYHPQRLSIEENVDGFHVHFRNYKLLLDRESFTEFARGMALALEKMADQPPPDPVTVLELNELDPALVSRARQDGQEEIAVRVAEVFRDKAAQALSGIGFVRQGPKRDGLFARGDQRVRLLGPAAEPARAATRPTEPGLVGLPEFIERDAGQLTPEALNLFKLKLLYLFKRAEAGHIPAFGIEDVVVKADSNTPSVDPFQHAEAIDPAEEYGRLSDLLTRHKLFFVKPGKQPYSPEERSALNDRFERHVREAIGSQPCVSRVYLIGSATADRSGRYNVPFVHFDWAKLASDFDLLIELDPDHEDEIPATWEKKFDWPRSGSVYAHLGDLGQGMASDYAKAYPGVRFFEQMLETYLFYPSRGNRADKDAFLDRPGVRVIFERPGVVDWFERHYPSKVRKIRRIRIASFNKVYDVSTEADRYALKVYPSRNTQGGQYQLLAYELAVVEGLAAFALDVPAPVRNLSGEYISEHPEGKAILFEYIDGHYVHEPGPKEAFLAGQLLARIHLYSGQIDIPPELTPPRVAATLVHWLDDYRRFVDRGLLPAVPGLDAYVARVREAGGRMVHCHGDVTPRNFIYRDGRCWLIDFQLAGVGPALLDLADGIVEFAARGKHFNPDAMVAFQAGYESLLPLDAAEEDALSGLLPAQLLAKQARTARAHDYGFEWNADLIATLQHGLALLGRAAPA